MAPVCGAELAGNSAGRGSEEMGSTPGGTHMVDRETSVVKAPGVMVVIRLSYRDSSLTELRPAKVSLFTQLIRLLLSILEEGGRGSRVVFSPLKR